ncbi:MAG: MiaB/RimO family radical SAM methylthiotransferase [Chloroflexota bacterium]|nr:MAG: MiaB/RimO family radical SAM methylthiotransferase [Chloroflexota bacterium]
MKIYLDTIGCRLNQSEIETFARQFRAAGHSIVASPDQADLVVINTCTVTAAAASDSRQKIRQAARSGSAEIVATGCWTTLNPKEALALPGVSRVIDNQAKERLVLDVLRLPAETFDMEPVEREPLPGARARTRAFVKVQDGCDNRCTFCITTIARGPGRSRTLEEVLGDIRLACNGSEAAKEVVLTGVHLGSWGYDFSPQQHLSDLIRSILANTDVPRLRLSSLEPWDLDESFFGLWENYRLCRHLHLPLQSGCAATLKRMARKTTPDSFAALASAARKSIPGVAITTDVIVGFPGEDEAEFAESLQFVKEMEFAGGHVFTYSSRPGTAAARMPRQVPHPLRKEFNARMRAAIRQSGQEYRRNLIGQTLDVLWESIEGLDGESWQVAGLTDNYVRVSAASPKPLQNEITPAHLLSLTEEGIAGSID